MRNLKATTGGTRKLTPRHTEAVKRQCLDHYAECEPQFFRQVDGWKDCDPGDMVRCDEDGDCVMLGTSWELRRSPADLAVRIFIHGETDLRVARRLIEKAAASLDLFDSTNDAGREGAMSSAQAILDREEGERRRLHEFRRCFGIGSGGDDDDLRRRIALWEQRSCRTNDVPF